MARVRPAARGAGGPPAGHRHRLAARAPRPAPPHARRDAPLARPHRPAPAARRPHGGGAPRPARRHHSPPSAPVNAL
ncbi:MAG: hypothetical protein DMD94_02330 [Candidatus Rokuibacteriota bacterium]|nr:MAG: hypothetical protein DMD94_02330 [Candidatus Rokubacteria bacterium]